jgi:tRNA(adenine34) deaminase
VEKDIFFMKKALIEAKKAYKKKEVPIGAVLVLNDQIIARGHNQTESRLDPTQHAEIICLRKAAKKLKNWRLLQATLYSTLEPCSMCAGALLQARVTRLVWGAPDKRCGANGSWADLFSLKHPFHQIMITSGVLEKECSEIIIHFFKQRREENNGKRF